ncbi:serine hydroxymethyltransferase [Stappia sp. GBMRC 2046]|uniref:Serine hydroxymethyltransferase n=2 Tax=Stappia sediminis TaxID=2692190 RepID=A0A7X3SA08_9HYPH|nr:serine hydroxymethyltransferase [Stappia sediminis]
MAEHAGNPGEIFLEFAQIGRQLKVTAVDAQTGVEVVVFGPVSTPQKSLQDLAVRKLKRRLEQLGH